MQQLIGAMRAAALQASRVDRKIYEYTDVEVFWLFREDVPGNPYKVYGAAIGEHRCEPTPGGDALYAVRGLIGILGSKESKPWPP
jgi:hypothetical protein